VIKFTPTVSGSHLPTSEFKFRELRSVGRFRNFEGRGSAIDNVSAPSSFTANAHNELYAFYTGKSDLLKKIAIANTGQPPHRFLHGLGSANDMSSQLQ